MYVIFSITFKARFKNITNINLNRLARIAVAYNDGFAVLWRRRSTVLVGRGTSFVVVFGLWDSSAVRRLALYSVRLFLLSTWQTSRKTISAKKLPVSLIFSLT